MTSEAKKIKENTQIFDEINYNRTKLERSFESINIEEIKFLSDEEKIKLEKQVKENEKNKIPKLEKIKIIEKDDLEKINNIIKKKIRINEPIKELLNDSLLEEWVREGRKLNKERKKCAFCGNTLTDKIWEKINNHFNKESDSLINNVEEELENLDSKEKLLNKFQVPDMDIISNLKDKFNAKKTEISNLKNELRDFYNIIKTELKKKKKNITVELEEIAFKDIKVNDVVSKINEIIEKHNTYCDNVEKEKDKLRKKLLYDEVKNLYISLKYKEKKEELEKNKRNVKEKEEKLDKLHEEIKKVGSNKEELEKSLKDETKAAELINEYLNQYFGRNDIRLEINNENNSLSNFVIYRENEKAKNLSEGECSLIAFSYFLATLKNYKEDENLILWIDDPISSLDNNNIFFIFGIIDKIISEYNYRQIFISTHNLDFLRYLKSIKKTSKNIGYFIVERLIKQNRITSKVKKMPNFLKEYTTEFHYLFSEMSKIKENDDNYLKRTYTQLYNIPNITRKFLEYYLFFKLPNNEKPLENLKEFFSIEESRSINRLINENSHLTFIDRAWKPLDIPEIKQIIDIIFNKIKQKDKDQFNALCEAIKK